METKDDKIKQRDMNDGEVDKIFATMDKPEAKNQLNTEKHKNSGKEECGGSDNEFEKVNNSDFDVDSKRKNDDKQMILSRNDFESLVNRVNRVDGLEMKKKDKIVKLFESVYSESSKDLDDSIKQLKKLKFDEYFEQQLKLYLYQIYCCSKYSIIINEILQTIMINDNYLHAFNDNIKTIVSNPSKIETEFKKMKQKLIKEDGHLDSKIENYFKYLNLNENDRYLIDKLYDKMSQLNIQSNQQNVEIVGQIEETISLILSATNNGSIETIFKNFNKIKATLDEDSFISFKNYLIKLLFILYSSVKFPRILIELCKSMMNNDFLRYSEYLLSMGLNPSLDNVVNQLKSVKQQLSLKDDEIKTEIKNYFKFIKIEDEEKQLIEEFYSEIKQLERQKSGKSFDKCEQIIANIKTTIHSILNQPNYYDLSKLYHKLCKDLNSNLKKLFDKYLFKLLHQSRFNEFPMIVNELFEVIRNNYIDYCGKSLENLLYLKLSTQKDEFQGELNKIYKIIKSEENKKLIKSCSMYLKSDENVKLIVDQLYEKMNHLKNTQSTDNDKAGVIHQIKELIHTMLDTSEFKKIYELFNNLKDYFDSGLNNHLENYLKSLLKTSRFDNYPFIVADIIKDLLSDEYFERFLKNLLNIKLNPQNFEHEFDDIQKCLSPSGDHELKTKIENYFKYVKLNKHERDIISGIYRKSHEMSNEVEIVTQMKRIIHLMLNTTDYFEIYGLFRNVHSYFNENFTYQFERDYLNPLLINLLKNQEYPMIIRDFIDLLINEYFKDFKHNLRSILNNSNNLENQLNEICQQSSSMNDKELKIKSEYCLKYLKLEKEEKSVIDCLFGTKSSMDSEGHRNIIDYGIAMILNETSAIETEKYFDTFKKDSSDELKTILDNYLSSEKFQQRLENEKIELLPKTLGRIVKRLQKIIQTSGEPKIIFQLLLSNPSVLEVDRLLKELKGFKDLTEEFKQEIVGYLKSDEHLVKFYLEKAKEIHENHLQNLTYYLIQLFRDNQCKSLSQNCIELILVDQKPTKPFVNLLKELQNSLNDSRRIDEYLKHIETIFDKKRLEDYILNNYIKKENVSNERFVSGPNEFNVVVIGQTGVGKSTLLNAMVNYLRYVTADDALNGQFEYIIPTEFELYGRNNELIRIRVGNDANEKFRSENHQGSATQQCRKYTMEYTTTEGKSFKINFIDTPGLSDARGSSQDKINLKNIYNYLLKFDKIHKICLVMKANTTKLDGFLKNAIDSLLSIFPKAAVDNIMYLFSFSRGSFYKPGDVMAVVKDIIQDYKKSRNLDLQKINKSNTFCFDNEAFRYLCATHQRIDYTDLSLDNYKLSWDKSRENALRFISTLDDTKFVTTDKIEQIQENRIELEKLYWEMEDKKYDQNEDSFKQTFNHYQQLSKDLDDLEVSNIGYYHHQYSSEIQSYKKIMLNDSLL